MRRSTCALPNVSLALIWLWIRHRSLSSSGVEVPVTSAPFTWSSSSCQVLSHRFPSGDTWVHRPPSRSYTSRLTHARTDARWPGVAGGSSVGFRALSGFTAPRRLPCFSMAQSSISSKSAFRSPEGIL